MAVAKTPQPAKGNGADAQPSERRKQAFFQMIAWSAGLRCPAAVLPERARCLAWRRKACNQP
eukprot:11174883-Lingulodinium_polyedra.AAC.1